MDTPSASSEDTEVDHRLSWFSFGPSTTTAPPQPALTIPRRDLLYYPMRRRGRCLILNYETFNIFRNGGTRAGSEKDVQALVQTFSRLGFEVPPPKTNLDKEETMTVLYGEAKRDHNQFDCFVLCVLSHGDKNEGEWGRGEDFFGNLVGFQ